MDGFKFMMIKRSEYLIKCPILSKPGPLRLVAYSSPYSVYVQTPENAHPNYISYVH